MSRSLSTLCPLIRPRAEAAIAHCVERGVLVMIVDTLRTREEAEAYLKDGTSWTTKSKHLPQQTCRTCGSSIGSYHMGHPMLGLSHAIDLAPYQTYELHGRNKLEWNASDPAWQVIGEAFEVNGLRWGGRWTTPDLGHGELVTVAGTETREA